MAAAAPADREGPAQPRKCRRTVRRGKTDRQIAARQRAPVPVARRPLSRVRVRARVRARARAVPPHPPKSARSDPAVGNAAARRRCRAGWHPRSRGADVRCLGMAAIVAGAVAMVLGFFGYGVSLVLFIVAMRHVGTARAGHGHPGDRRPADRPGSLASPHRAPRTRTSRSGGAGHPSPKLAYSRGDYAQP